MHAPITFASTNLDFILRSKGIRRARRTVFGSAGRGTRWCRYGVGIGVGTRCWWITVWIRVAQSW